MYKRMTPAAFREALARLGLTQYEAAVLLERQRRLIRDWASGRKPIPQSITYSLMCHFVWDSLPKINIPVGAGMFFPLVNSIIGARTLFAYFTMAKKYPSYAPKFCRQIGSSRSHAGGAGEGARTVGPGENYAWRYTRETLQTLWSNLSAEGPGAALLQPPMSQGCAARRAWDAAWRPIQTDTRDAEITGPSQRLGGGD
jgi:hypothetical protein